MLTWFAECVCEILHVDLYMIQRNVFKVYKNRWSRIICKEHCIFRNVAKWGSYFVIFWTFWHIL